jgi:hypothetical protein
VEALAPFTADTQRTAPPYKGAGRRPPLIYREAAPSLKTHVLAAGRAAVRQVTWRTGSRQRSGRNRPMRGHFVFLRLRPASLVHRRAADFGDLPARWLIAEWPPGEPEPTRYWLSNLPENTSYRRLVRMAKLRWRIEHDYRESRPDSAWTTTKAAPGKAGTTTPPSSPPPTHS